MGSEISEKWKVTLIKKLILKARWELTNLINNPRFKSVAFHPSLRISIINYAGFFTICALTLFKNDVMSEADFTPFVLLHCLSEFFGHVSATTLLLTLFLSSPPPLLSSNSLSPDPSPHSLLAPPSPFAPPSPLSPPFPPLPPSVTLPPQPLHYPFLAPP